MFWCAGRFRNGTVLEAGYWLPESRGPQSTSDRTCYRPGQRSTNLLANSGAGGRRLPRGEKFADLRVAGVASTARSAASTHIAHGLRTEDRNAIDDLRFLDLQAAADQSISNWTMNVHRSSGGSAGLTVNETESQLQIQYPPSLSSSRTHFQEIFQLQRTTNDTQTTSYCRNTGYGECVHRGFCRWTG